jgi:hypothetical protein
VGVEERLGRCPGRRVQPGGELGAALLGVVAGPGDGGGPVAPGSVQDAGQALDAGGVGVQSDEDGEVGRAGGAAGRGEQGVERTGLLGG